MRIAAAQSVQVAAWSASGARQNTHAGGNSRSRHRLTQPESVVDRAPMQPSMPDMPDTRNWFTPPPELRRRRFNSGERHGAQITIQGRTLLNFAGNDYLGLSFHPAVVQAAREALGRLGTGSGASRLVSGDDPLMHQLETELAAWKGFEACLLAGSGMLANLGLLQALADRHCTLFCDRLNHASLVDGARLSGARVKRFAHLDTRQLERNLLASDAQRRIIVSDGVFSMDGDCVDVSTLLELAERHDALLLLDDAHGFGVLGEGGRGLTSATDAKGRIAGHARLIEVGTCGKALGSFGAFILGTLEMIEGLRQSLRTMTYSTALPPAVCAATLAALHVVQQGDAVQRLHANIELFRRLAENHGLHLMPSFTPIQPLQQGSESAALGASRALQDAGFFVPAIRPPTVPEGTSRLRITLSAAHTAGDIGALVQALAGMRA